MPTSGWQCYLLLQGTEMKTALALNVSTYLFPPSSCCGAGGIRCLNDIISCTFTEMYDDLSQNTRLSWKFKVQVRLTLMSFVTIPVFPAAASTFWDDIYMSASSFPSDMYPSKASSISYIHTSVTEIRM